jgi:aminoglycoside phosphotransferase (APT) family kinase protein
MAHAPFRTNDCGLCGILWTRAKCGRLARHKKMTDPDLLSALHTVLPEDRLGNIVGIEPITVGLSGAGVYAVTTSRGAFILRLQGQRFEESFAQQLRVLRRASEAGVAPAVVHVDEAARAVVSQRVQGTPIAAALADPTQRGTVLGAIVDQLRALHALDTSGVAERDPLAYARETWESGRRRPGFPPWAMALEPMFERLAAVLGADPRRVLSHNDCNPMNVIWDGTRAWFVDWEVSGRGHPYYDLGTLAMFLCLDDDVSLQLAARHDGAPLDERSRASFRALRQLSALLCGLTFLSLVPDLSLSSASTLAAAPTLQGCYAALRTGQLDLQSAAGRVAFGTALLALGVAS